MNEQKHLKQGIAALEAQRAELGDAVVDALVAAAREKLARIAAPEAPAPAPRAGEVGAQGVVLRGERKLVTVIVVDVKGSTQLLEALGTEAWVELMNRVFHILETEIYRFGGVVDQFRGDGLVAFFGAETTHEDDPERAVLASLAMQAAIQRYATELANRRGIDMLLRIGINTGEAIVASIGDRTQYAENTAMGEAIAVAARLESAAEPGTVLVSQSTYRLTHAQFRWRALGEITVKGVSRSLAVYRPLAARAVPGKVRGIAGLSSPLVGRSNELAALHDAVARVRAGEGGIITLVGEAGVGKSRLVAELRTSIDESVRWVEGRGISYGTSMAYLLWIDVVRGLLGVQPEDPPPVVQAALRDCAARLGRAQLRHPDRVEGLYPYLGRLLSLPLNPQIETALRAQGSEQRKRGTFRAVETLIEGTAQHSPLVIVCEDLHWSDPTSVELLERLFALTRRAAVLFVCVGRSATSSSAEQSSVGQSSTSPYLRLLKALSRHYPDQHTDLWLVPLSFAESEALMRQLLPMDGLPDVLKVRILTHAEGNPLYVEEIIRSLIDSGVLIQDRSTGHWGATREPADLAIPDTLYGVLMTRIDRLPEHAKRVLQLAAVIGRNFQHTVLAAINPGDDELERVLLTLQKEDLIRVRAWEPVLEYSFKHQLIQEAAYRGLLQQERQMYHQWVAEVTEQLFPKRAESQAGLLSHHWERSEEPERAVAYLLRAGEQAAAQFANTEALDAFSRALALAGGDTEQRYRLLLAREKVYGLLGRRERQAQDLAALSSLAQASGDPRCLAEVALRRARLAEARGDYAATIEAAREAIRQAKTSRDTRSEAAGYLCWGRAQVHQEDRQGAYKQLQKALDRAAGQFPQVEAEALRSLGLVTPDPAEARGHLKQALHIHRKIGDRRGEWAALYDLSVLAWEEGRLTKATGYCRRALRICRQIGDRQGEMMALDNLGFLAAYIGAYAEAREHYEQALAVAGKLEDKRGQLRLLLHLSGVALHLGAPEQALSHAERALGYSERATADPPLDAEARIAVARALTALATQVEGGHSLAGLREAHTIYAETLEQLQQLAEPSPAEVLALAGLAELALLAGDVELARDHVDELLAAMDAVDFYETANAYEVMLTCIRVLQAARDRRTRKILARAYHGLRERADQIAKADMRRAFLENVEAHRALGELYEGK